MQDTDIFIQVTHDLERIWLKSTSPFFAVLQCGCYVIPTFAIFWCKYSQNRHAYTRGEM